jgi:hypothetical protein
VSEIPLHANNEFDWFEGRRQTLAFVFVTRLDMFLIDWSWRTCLTGISTILI